MRLAETEFFEEFLKLRYSSVRPRIFCDSREFGHVAIGGNLKPAFSVRSMIPVPVIRVLEFDRSDLTY
jgi:hypothetical protein